MLGRAATRIELNRDSDMDELEQERVRRIQEHERQMMSHQAPFGQRVVNARNMHNSQHFVQSIFTNDSSSSGLGTHSMLQMPNFQPHNLVGSDIQDHQALTPNIGTSYAANAAGGDNSSNSLLIYGVGPAHTHSHTTAARTNAQQQRIHPTAGFQSHSYSAQAQAQSSMHHFAPEGQGGAPPNFHPSQPHGGGQMF